MKTQTIGAFEAKNHFSELIEKAHHGMTFIITRRGRPVAQICPSEAQSNRPVFGSEKDKIKMTSDFNEPLADMSEYEN